MKLYNNKLQHLFSRFSSHPLCPPGLGTLSRRDCLVSYALAWMASLDPTTSWRLSLLFTCTKIPRPLRSMGFGITRLPLLPFEDLYPLYTETIRTLSTIIPFPPNSDTILQNIQCPGEPSLQYLISNKIYWNCILFQLPLICMAIQKAYYCLWLLTS